MNDTNSQAQSAATNESNLESQLSGVPVVPQASSLNPQPAFPRSPNETPRAYSAFMTFFQLGHARTLQAVADKLGENISTVQRWSSKFSWSDRIQSYNAGILQQHAETEAASQREQAARWSARMNELRQLEWTAIEKLFSAVHCYLEGYGEEQLEKMTIAQVARAMHIGASMGRQTIGVEVTEKKTDPEKSPLQLKLLADLERIRANPTNTPTAEQREPRHSMSVVNAQPSAVN